MMASLSLGCPWGASLSLPKWILGVVNNDELIKHGNRDERRKERAVETCNSLGQQRMRHNHNGLSEFEGWKGV